MLSVAILSLLAIPADAVTADEGRLLGNLLTATLGKDKRVEVVSAGEVRRALEFEGQRQELGCSTESCLAEIAGALGADLVVFGDVGRLDDRVVLSLNLFDAKNGTTVGRAIADAESVGALRAHLDAAAHELLSGFLSTRRETAPRAKIVVLDLQTTVPTAPPAEPPQEWLPILPVAVTAGGVAVLAASGLALWYSYEEHALAVDGSTPQPDVAAHKSTSDATGWVGIAAASLGAVGLGIGASLLLAGGEP